MTNVGPANAKLADDLIYGCAAIAEELGVDQRRCFYMLERGLVPSVKIGRKWACSRLALRRHFQQSEVA